MKTSEFKISIQVESYDEKTAENYWNWYVGAVSEQLNILIPNIDGTNWWVERRFCQNFISLSFILTAVLELFECRRGDPYMTANRNFVCFAYS